MKASLFSRRFLLSNLLAALTGWLGACQRRAIAPSPQPASRSIPQPEQRDLDARTTMQVDELGVRTVYSYDADGHLQSEQRHDEVPYNYDADNQIRIEQRGHKPPAPRSTPNPEAP